jgi:hypothetical protein
MSETIMESGDKLHIMTRRLFEEDIRRHFVGEIMAVQGDLALIRGYTFIFNHSTNEYRRLPEVRSRIISVGDAGHIVNKIPRDTEIETISYKTVGERLVVEDNRNFTLSINEFGAMR